jgi:hypothetical protein
MQLRNNLSTAVCHNLYGSPAAEFLGVMSREIRSYDSEQDIRNAWKVRKPRTTDARTRCNAVCCYHSWRVSQTGSSNRQ